jgi:predicted MFS family arabinose efflux permease
MSAVNNIITSMIPLERGKGAGLFAGMMDAFCYVGSTLSGFVPGLIIEHLGFSSLLSLLPLCALVLAAFSLSITLLGLRRKKRNNP